ncbi:NADP(+)-dependent dehydrogenase [Penicillium longicatenatum]|uniref:NADP(+)-dependent dehydrogenase n=1 Tax=Penicillium longicatenatum TaxID=1561947 RepID=UPI00254827E8|nr:NADP(+)-dependent dehydrogenase [Penicillium longicatenatum]KAJ5650492.1 NADP(+)-dependent dehydrogenase [Penicillium longicatenatum]
MNPPLPSLTSVWHNAPYAAISPERPELSALGKTVIITGAGSGIGQATALAFARAGAAKIVLIGRNEEKLQSTQKQLDCPSSIHAANVTNEAAITQVATSIGTWDIMILAAGHISPRVHMREASVTEWWQNFETNVKGTMIAANAFLPTANQTHSAIVAFSAGVFFPPGRLAGLSGYISSKFTLIKVMEFLAAENPNVFAAALHPGMIETDNFRASGADPSKLPMDSVNLPAEFLVWLTSPEAAFLNGRFAMANWDVEELKTKADQIQSGQLLTSGVNGWPFSPI